MLEEARKEIRDSKERAQIRPIHTFSPLPGFFPRPAEIRAINETLLQGIPNFTVLFGASSVGKTALLREILSSKRYHVLYFDLRIAGFASLRSLYFSLASQLERYFDRLKLDEGWGEWEKEAWAFKYDRMDVERRDGEVECADVARLMELFQSALLKYWQFEPVRGDAQADDDKDKERTNDIEKKVPVVLFDEAHKLPALIQSIDAMKILLDAMLVLTKQDRLCHVIHATSDPFYQTWLRQLNVMQHCKIITITDCTLPETKSYFNDHLMGGVPVSLRSRLRGRFEELYEAFGGKLAHWDDFVRDFVGRGGALRVEETSHFLQAHALLNLQLLHSNTDRGKRPKEGFRIYSPLSPEMRSTAAAMSRSKELDDIPGALGGGGGGGGRMDENSLPPIESPSFTSEDMLTVMDRLTSSPSSSSSSSPSKEKEKTTTKQKHIPYFPLCREMGAAAVDEMVRGRVLELRWTPCVGAGVTSEAWAGVSEEQSEEQSGTGQGRGRGHHGSEDEGVGPVLLPTTPILGYAMRVVLKEWRGKGKADPERPERSAK